MRDFPLPVVPASATARPEQRNEPRPIVLIGFQHQGNLGLGYLAATLRRAGYRVVLLDIEAPSSQLVAATQAAQPLLIGFSLIFQFYLPRFAELARCLRRHHPQTHFTIGGHLPSLSPTLTLAEMPELDSAVRFEGEQTLLELVDCLSRGQSWRPLAGLAVRDGERVQLNPLRPLIHDLDSLPYPDREFAPESILGQRAMPLIASRGCSRTCAFCSIHTFYRQVPGKVVRTRNPARVVEEMYALHHERGINIFLFQDDDFPLYGPAWQRWTRQFVGELWQAGLPGRIAWKINCRADAVDRALFTEMRDAGLYLVYMGLESGSEEGLATLNKRIAVDQNRQAVACLKELGLMFEFGFMLFDPSSSFASLRDNIGFLRDIVGDGSAAAVFCRMLPYEGTPIKEQLAAEGRLRGDLCNPDYDFLDPRIEQLYDEVHQLFGLAGWIHGERALSPKINWAWNELAIVRRLFPGVEAGSRYAASLRAITRDANRLLFRVLEAAWRSHQRNRSSGWSEAALAAAIDELLERLLRARNRFILGRQIGLSRELRRCGLLAA